jgi:hypothetical protein
MTTTTTDVATITPLAHQEAMRLQAHELERSLRLLRSLDQASWAAATDCPAWDIRAMHQHVLGACEAGASTRENIRQLRRGGRGPTAGGASTPPAPPDSHPSSPPATTAAPSPTSPPNGHAATASRSCSISPARPAAATPATPAPPPPNACPRTPSNSAAPWPAAPPAAGLLTTIVPF